MRLKPGSALTPRDAGKPTSISPSAKVMLRNSIFLANLLLLLPRDRMIYYNKFRGKSHKNSHFLKTSVRWPEDEHTEVPPGSQTNKLPIPNWRQEGKEHELVNKHTVEWSPGGTWMEKASWTKTATACFQGLALGNCAGMRGRQPGKD